MTADNENATTPAEDESQSVPAQEERKATGGNGLWAALAFILLAAIILLLVATRLVPRVPNVTGMTRAAAESALKSAGYTTGTISTVSTNKISRGHVVDQAPVGNSVFPKGGSVDLIVVQGADMVKVPDVVGHDSAEAAVTIGATGLGLKSVAQNSDTVPASAVMAQVPAAGSLVPASAAVTIIVSQGAQSDALAGGTSGTQAGSSGAPSSGASGGNGSTTSPQSSAYTASYPGSTVYSDAGDIYIRFPGGRGAYLTGGAPWDTNPILSPNAEYVVFMRAPHKGAPANQIGRVNLTNNQTTILNLPYPRDFCSASQVQYTSMRFAPSTGGTSPNSNWLVLGQLFPNDPDAGGNMGGRLLICNVPMDSSWVSWNNMLRPAETLLISGSSTAGSVHVKSPGVGAPGFSRDFNAYTGLYTN